MSEPTNGGKLREWMRMAYSSARTYSHDRSTRNGCIVIHDDWHDPIWSANRFPRGVDYLGDPKVHERPLKYSLIVHAERDAIYDAARNGIPLDGATMVCPWAPCAACAQAIIQSGIDRLVTHRDRHDATPERWRAEVALGLKMLRDADVEVVWLEGPVDAGVTILFDGEEIAV